MSGFFERSPEEDLNLTLRIANRVASKWDERAAKKYQINLMVDKSAAKICCEKAAELFDGRESHSEFFPKQPGPFKRTAAFVVLGRLHPFFIMTGSGAPSKNNTEARDAWLARFLALTIPAVLCKLKVEIDGESRNLNQWNGFPSRHYQLEFLAWLRWLDNFSHQWIKQPHIRSIHWERLARMVMSTSLMIEACYYLGNSTPDEQSIQGRDDNCLKKLTPELETDLEYTELVFPPKSDFDHEYLSTTHPLISEFHKLSSN